MNKLEFIKAVAAKSGKTQKEIKDIVAAIQEVVYESVKAGEDVKIIDGLTVTTVDRPERVYHSPATGEEIIKPAGKSVKVKLGKAMKTLVD